MQFETVTTDRHPDDDRIAVVRLDAPDRSNLIDIQMLHELTEATIDADRDGDVHGIVLGSAGEDFCAGAALQEIKELSFEDGARWLSAYFDVLDLLRDTGKPVVAAVEGTCVAGGNELVSACDLVVAGESARFGQPEVGVGSTAAGGGVQLLPLIVGEKRARDILLTGRLLTAEEAKSMGLINRVVDDGDAEQRAVDLVETIVEENSPQAYRIIKAILKQWTNVGLTGQEMARDLTAGVWASEEFHDRAEAFLAGKTVDSRPFQGTHPPAPEG